MQRRIYIYLILSISICIAFSSSQTNGDLITSTATSLANSTTNIGNSNAAAVSTAGTNNQSQTTINGLIYSDGKLIGTNFANAAANGAMSTTAIPVLNPSNTIITTVKTIQCSANQWESTNKQAVDIGVSSQGDVYAAGLDGYLYYYNFLSNTWSLAQTEDSDLSNISRVAVKHDGTPFVISSAGETFYHNCNKEWVRLPGCATDIAVGRAGEVFKLGCDLEANGFGLYKLFCDSEDNGTESLNTSENKCLRFRKWWRCTNCSKKTIEKKCYWFKVSGSGVRVSVNTRGNPVLITVDGDIIVYDDANWYTVLKGKQARDIAVSNDEEIFFNDASRNIYKISKGNFIRVRICGEAKALSVGPYGQPYVIASDQLVYTSSKQCYN